MNKRGGMSVILASVVVLVIVSITVLNIFIGLSEINTVGNLHSILRTETDTVANNKKVTGNMYSFFDKDIQHYLPVLKDYTTIYTIYEYNNGSIEQVNQINGDGNLDIELKTNQILEITVKQNTVSTLQKMNNLLSGRNSEGSIVVSEKRAVN